MIISYKRKISTSLLTLFFLLQFTACDNDESDTKIGDMSQPEYEQVCKDTVKTYVDSIPSPQVMCRLVGIASIVPLLEKEIATPSNQLQESCSNSQKTCLDNIKEKPALPDPGQACKGKKVPEECNVTSGDIEKCQNEQIDIFNGISKKLPQCDKVTLLSLAPLAGLKNIQEPESCTKIKEECPSIYNDIKIDPSILSGFTGTK